MLGIGEDVKIFEKIKFNSPILRLFKIMEKHENFFGKEKEKPSESGSKEFVKWFLQKEVEREVGSAHLVKREKEGGKGIPQVDLNTVREEIYRLFDLWVSLMEEGFGPKWRSLFFEENAKEKLRRLSEEEKMAKKWPEISRRVDEISKGCEKIEKEISTEDERLILAFLKNMLILARYLTLIEKLK